MIPSMNVFHPAARMSTVHGTSIRPNEQCSAGKFSLDSHTCVLMSFSRLHRNIRTGLYN